MLHGCYMVLTNYLKLDSRGPCPKSLQQHLRNTYFPYENLIILQLQSYSDSSCIVLTLGDYNTYTCIVHTYIYVHIHIFKRSTIFVTGKISLLSQESKSSPKKDRDTIECFRISVISRLLVKDFQKRTLLKVNKGSQKVDITNLQDVGVKTFQYYRLGSKNRICSVNFISLVFDSDDS